METLVAFISLDKKLPSRLPIFLFLFFRCFPTFDRRSVRISLFDPQFLLSLSRSVACFRDPEERTSIESSRRHITQRDCLQKSSASLLVLKFDTDLHEGWIQDAAIPSPSSMIDFGDSLLFSLPQLVEFRLSMNSSEYVALKTSPFAPGSLQVLDLCYLPEHHLDYPSLFRTLTSLEIESNCNHSDWRELLEECSQTLKYLKIEINDGEDGKGLSPLEFLSCSCWIFSSGMGGISHPG